MHRRPRMKKKSAGEIARWRPEDSADLYGIQRWGKGMFSINADGEVVLQNDNENADINMKSLVDEIQLREMSLPVLIRFTDILKQRMHKISHAFKQAMSAEEYTGRHCPVYPIKVNQHRHILEDIMQEGHEVNIGLECGSKAELLLCIALHDNPEALLICNGFKDRDYIEIALSASQMGYPIFLVVERFKELPLILEVAKELDVEPRIGIRMKLATRGRGPWEASGGDGSKFGLRASEIVDAIKLLKRRRCLRYLGLLHFHIGSQVTDIHPIKAAMREAACIYIEVCRLGAPIRYLDVGGGLAVDYDGSHTNFASSSNYGVSEYAADIINAIQTACDESNTPHPDIVTETGRALVAHHSVLVFEAIAESDSMEDQALPTVPPKSPEIVKRMKEIVDSFKGKNFQEIYHAAVEARQEALVLFSLRQLSIEHRGVIEKMFQLVCHRILSYSRLLDYVPEDIEALERFLSTTYFCNFSVFQSLPDHWAIKQIFPVMPLHRLNEKPTRRGILADITCDSDGVIDRFIDLRDVKDTLPLHALREDEPYYIGVFLVGAYQEILGDLHNLFGDTHLVHVSSGLDGYVIDKVVEGENVEDVLDYIAFDRDGLIALLRRRIELALQEKRLPLRKAAPLLRRLNQGLDTYTYLSS